MTVAGGEDASARNRGCAHRIENGSNQDIRSVIPLQFCAGLDELQDVQGEKMTRTWGRRTRRPMVCCVCHWRWMARS